MKTCRRCGDPAETTIEGRGAIFDDVDCCKPCAESFLVGWELMQAAAAKYRVMGVHPALLNRIMCLRVERGDFRVPDEKFLVKG